MTDPSIEIEIQTELPDGHLATLGGDFDDLTPDEARNVPADPYTDMTTLWVMEDIETGRRIWCLVNDRGPYVIEDENGSIFPTTPSDTPADGQQWIRVLDLSVRSAKELGVFGGGLFRVRIRYWNQSRGSVRVAFHD